MEIKEFDCYETLIALMESSPDSEFKLIGASLVVAETLGFLLQNNPLFVEIDINNDDITLKKRSY